MDSFADNRAIWLPNRFAISDAFFVEIFDGDNLIQGFFRILTGKEYVVGEFGKWRQSSQTFYGEFRSKKLFQWYQKYSHHWLEAEN
ncbi:hypothetical protein CSB45_14760 [candidate division KSB3 bacterium]|uniref:Uncharacterized protein n=1 Tax=candidate division KSB3 bacterium TaxID=2044937 RepID=A0A2G6E1Q6_9BACT|nr:MAG: hypothetical protein CSB45_14760 [candidate division KSB3 bacterium]PIE31084.1 MAG: hypothetical protein CSA57_00275 [candidate division KSB3 bacterium]